MSDTYYINKKISTQNCSAYWTVFWYTLEEMKNTEVISKVHSLTNIGIGAVVYMVSYIFAVILLMFLFFSGIDITLYVAVGILGSFLNFLLYKMSLSGYHVWSKNSFGHDLTKVPFMFLFIPPFSIFIMSSSLMVYISSYFSLEAKGVWEEGLYLLPNFLNFITDSIVITGLVMIIILGMFMIIGILQKYKNQKIPINRKRYLYFITIGVVVLVMILRFYGSYDEGNIFYVIVSQHSRLLLVFFLGFIPLHWFYEIFVVPFKSKIKVKRWLIRTR